MRRVRLLEDFLQDLRFAARLMARSPGFAVTAVLLLALGIGANTAIFGLIDAVLLRSLPVERPEQLVFIRATGSEGSSGAPPYPCFDRIRTGTSSFAGMAAFASDELKVQVGSSVEQVFGQVVSGSYFELLGLKPAAGRLLAPGDERLDPPVAVIGYGYWQRRFGGRPEAIGKTISFRDRAFTIVGVTRPEFWGLQPGREVAVSLPITQERGLLADSGAWWFDIVARLRPEAAVERAAVESNTIFQRFMNERGRSGDLRKKHFDHIELVPAGRGLDRLRARFSQPLHALMLVAAVVLLFACVNLSCLLLARGAARSHELAIRQATGAASGRLLRQLLTETFALFALGGAASLFVAHAGIRLLTGFFAIGRNPIVLDVQYDWRLLAFAVAAALASGLIAGLWPAVRALPDSPHAAMKEGEVRLTGSRRTRVANRWLIASQAALSLVLLVAAVLFAATMMNLRAVDLGFQASGVLTMSLNPGLPNSAPAARDQFWREILRRVRALPGIRSGSLSVLTPLSGRDAGKLVTGSGFRPRVESDSIAHLNHVSEDYFRTFGIRLRAGRVFTPQDGASGLRVAVVNESAARRFFSGRSPVGELVRFVGPLSEHNDGRSGYQIVGVVSDHKHMNIREPAPPFVFVPLWQPVDSIGRLTLAVSSDLPPAALYRAVAETVRTIRSNTLVSDVVPANEQVDATLVSERLLSMLATAFALLALALAAVGLYGTLSYSVARRRAEIGVRIALGARPTRVAWSLVAALLAQVGVGLVIGLPAALLLARSSEGVLFGIAAADPRSYVLSAAVLAAIACVAAWGPSRRILAIDPAEALRRE
jgi:predicted permease